MVVIKSVRLHMSVMLVCPEAMAQGAHRVEAPWCLHIIATDVAEAPLPQLQTRDTAERHIALRSS